MGQNLVLATALRLQVRRHVGQAAFGELGRLHAFHALHGRAHGGDVLHGLGDHVAHFVEHHKQRADELGVELVGHFHAVGLRQASKFRVILGLLDQAFQDADEGVELLRRDFRALKVHAQLLLERLELLRISHPQRGQRRIIGVCAGDGDGLALRLFALHAHACRQGHDSFICHGCPFRFWPLAPQGAARRKRTRYRAKLSRKELSFVH